MRLFHLAFDINMKDDNVGSTDFIDLNLFRWHVAASYQNFPCKNCI